jgi:hypothetical protein
MSHEGWTSDSSARAAVSFGVCWISAGLALVSTFVGNRQGWPVQALFLGMLFRMGLPLGAMIVLPSVGGPLAPPGIATTILGVYLVTLLVETLLAVRMISPLSGTSAKAA